jgi:hypothetical protein
MILLRGTLKAVSNLSVEGYSTTGQFEPVTHEGTIKWMVLDDKGDQCNLIIPNSLYIPTNDNRLLSPQHLAQVLHGKKRIKNGTRCTTYAHAMVLPIDRHTANIGKMYTAPGFSKYMAYAVRTTELFPEDTQHQIICNRIEVQNNERHHT